MRIDITLPDDKAFKDELQRLAAAEHRNQKNYIERLVIEHVRSLSTETIHGKFVATKKPK